MKRFLVFIYRLLERCCQNILTFYKRNLMLPKNYEQFYHELKTKVDKKRIYTDPLRLLTYGTDAGFYRLIPKLIVKAYNEQEVQYIVRLASKYELPITFRAAGTSLSGQAISDSILVMTGQGWENYHIEEGAERIIVQPGIVGKRVNALLKRYGRKLGPDPASVGSALIGGIVINNASGMNGTGENSYQTIEAARIMLADGTVLDTGSKESRKAFMQSHPHIIEGIKTLKKQIEEDKELKERIVKKYQIKNTTGIGLNSFTDYEDPFDILLHLMVGSEGTLAFLSEVTLKTLPIKPYKASAMLYFENIVEASRAVLGIRHTKAHCAELLDRLALKAVENNDGIPAYIKDFPDHTTAVLVEVDAFDEKTLKEEIDEVKQALASFKTVRPIEFTDKPEEYLKYWAVRSGIFPSVGGMRQIGTACLIEDVCFPLDVLPEATNDLQQLLIRHKYDDAVIYGHAIEGNFHFIINQNFSDPSEVARFEALIDDVVKLVVDKYDGSLKAEHGTGRNVAPFVKYEWGEKAFGVMQAVKNLLDPKNLLNRDVIFSNDPRGHIKNLKALTPTNDKVDKCIECGFCEVSCLTAGFSLSARQRIVAQREISRLELSGENPDMVRELKKGFRYLGNQTCAKDGLCATTCPVKIDTGKLIQDIREQEAGKTAKKLAHSTANHFGGITSTARVGLKFVHVMRMVMGKTIFGFIARTARAITFNSIPLWTPSMPKGISKPQQPQINPTNPLKVVYFPSCINQVMGPAKGDPDQHPLHEVMVGLLKRAGYEVIFPENMGKLCCGTIWESKGFPEQADQKSAELEQALIAVSENGKYPVLCDQSPCLYRMRNTIKGMYMYEPVEFIDKFLMDKLKFRKLNETVAVHSTCTTIKMGNQELIAKIAAACVENVVVPEEVACCGFAGDRGFTFPEVNTYALRKLHPAIEQSGATVGYSNSRTCEIGLTTNSGIPYSSIVYLVDKSTK